MCPLIQIIANAYKKRKIKTLSATLQPFQKNTTITQMGGVVELSGSASMRPLN